VSGVNLRNSHRRRHYILLCYAETVRVVVVGNHVKTHRGPVSGTAMRPGPRPRRRRRREDGRVPVAGSHEPQVVRFAVHPGPAEQVFHGLCKHNGGSESANPGGDAQPQEPDCDRGIGYGRYDRHRKQGRADQQIRVRPQK